MGAQDGTPSDGLGSSALAAGSGASAGPIGAAWLEALPAHARAVVFGVAYARLRSAAGHELFLTRDGWRWREHLAPERWYDGAAFAARGTRLTRSTGTVYRVATEVGGRVLQSVVKISRVAQHLERGQLLRGPAGVEPPRFASPFEEFAALARLRASRRGPRILTKRPLAILCSATPYRAWELGRDPGELAWHAARMERDQRARPGAVGLEAQRDYVVVFEWIDGATLLDLRAAGVIDEAGMRAITLDVIADLERHGVRVLDHKPDHVIVRPRADGTLPRRRGRLVYALADYELLVDVPAAGARPAPEAPRAEAAAG